MTLPLRQGPGVTHSTACTLYTLSTVPCIHPTASHSVLLRPYSPPGHQWQLATNITSIEPRNLCQPQGLALASCCCASSVDIKWLLMCVRNIVTEEAYKNIFCSCKNILSPSSRFIYDCFYPVMFLKLDPTRHKSKVSTASFCVSLLVHR